MRYLLAVALLVAASAMILAQPGDPEGPSPQDHAELAVKYLRRQSFSTRRHIRFLSYLGTPRATVVRRQKSMRFWVNQLHFESAPSFPSPVAGSNGTLYTIDLREYGWSSEAFSAVARREPYFREPFVDSSTAETLRYLTGTVQDPKSLHVEAVVRADWLFRETFESDRSKSYYDLLFAKQRFGTELVRSKDRQETYRATDGRLYTRNVPGTSRRVVKQADFPKNEADFEKIFAVDKFREHFKEFKIDTRHGAVVEGMENGVSIVSRQNRLIERIITSMGSYYKTFDVKKTSGKRDFAETLNKDFEFDAGEILADLPAGGFAALLVNAQGGIVEVADNRFATDTSDLKYDARVRTPGSCFICHEMKYIKPKNLVEDMLKAGVNIKFKRKEDAVAAKGFFLRWTGKLVSEQERFVEFIAETSGFKPGENALQLKEWRDEYDAPVDLKTACREFGITQEKFKLVALKATKSRIGMLAKGMTIPRGSFEDDVYPEFQRLLIARPK